MSARGVPSGWRLAGSCLIVLGGCGPKATPPSTGGESLSVPGTLTVLHTNDLHGHFLPERADWIEGEPEIGGFEMIDAWVSSIRVERGADAVLLLDGGDIITGTPLTDFVVDGAGGGAMLEFMEAVGYDAMALGNHEFDQGFDNLQALITAADFHVLSANVRGPDGAPAFEGLLPSTVIERNGVRIGLIGATTEGLAGLVSPEDNARLQTLSVIDAVSAEVGVLDERTDLLIAVTHIGLEADRALAEAVEGLDLIVGGHSHTRLPEPEKVGDTWVVQAGNHGQNLGVLELQVSNDRVTSFDGGLVALDPDQAPGPPGQTVDALVESYQRKIEEFYGQVIGEAPVSLRRSYTKEETLGRWITDVLREATGAEVAIYNAGGLRADLSAGDITLRDVYEIFPFGNQVVTMELSGAEVLGVLLTNARAAHSGEGSFNPISGAVIQWREWLDVAEAVEVTIAGEPLDPARTYTVATNSYLADQAVRKLSGATPEAVEPLGQTVFEVASEAARAGPVVAPDDARTIEVKE